MFVTIHSTQSKYFVASRKFELPELKLLIDAVESSKFITKKKSDALIEKIHTLTSPVQVKKLKHNNYVVMQDENIKNDLQEIVKIANRTLKIAQINKAKEEERKRNCQTLVVAPFVYIEEVLL